MSRYKRLYESMSIAGDLKEVFPRLSGEWLKDKDKFIKEQQRLEEYINLEVEIEEEDNDYE